MGTDVERQTFLDTIKDFEPDILGMSALPTTAVRSIGEAIKALEKARLRNQAEARIGGVPVTQPFADDFGAEGYAATAASAADRAKQFGGAT